MAIENCGCGGNALDRFYSLFVCDHANCSQCIWTNNKCCNGCYADESCSTDTCKDGCLNYYDINMQDVISSRIKSFGYCDNQRALAIQFTDGSKKLYLNVDREIYDDLVALNKDTLYMHLVNSLCNENNQCISIP